MVETNRLIEKRIRASALYHDLQKTLGQMCDLLGEAAGAAIGPMRAELSEMLLSGGKRLRPMLAYVCYRMGGRRDKPVTPLMCMLELMHTASIIHDDVVDGASRRRGKPTINNLRGCRAAVQSGDFLLAKAMELLHNYKGTGVNEMLAEVSYNMTIGELRQQSMRYEFGSQSMTAYYDLITKKTALLFAASCWCGAIAGGMDDAAAGYLYNYGEMLGIAFQLRDDLIDFSDTSGKGLGQDIINGVFTLPMLMLMERGTPASLRELLYKKDKTESEVSLLVDYVKQSGALDESESVICEKSRQAMLMLESFPHCPEKKALGDLVLSLAERQS